MLCFCCCYLLLNSRQDSGKEIKQTAQGTQKGQRWTLFSGSPNVRKRWAVKRHNSNAAAAATLQQQQEVAAAQQQRREAAKWSGVWRHQVADAAAPWLPAKNAFYLMLHAFIANISHAPRLGRPTIANDAGAVQQKEQLKDLHQNKNCVIKRTKENISLLLQSIVIN